MILAIALTSCREESGRADAGRENTETAMKTGEATHGKVVVDVDPALFVAEALVADVTTEEMTLSDGSNALCYVITTKPMAPDHPMGPWCPRHVTDDASKGGIWVEDGDVYDVDGAFIANMAEFYSDDAWLMHDEGGNIHVTKTEEECAAAARPDVDEAFTNHCVECLPSYIEELTTIVRLPVTPVALAEPELFGRGPASSRGIALNGIVFDAPAPTDAILGAHTLAPFDDAGGHVNLHVGYHYHAATGVSTSIEQGDGHAPMIGYAMDGYGIFARLDDDGNEPSDLDECGGHYDGVRGYHYHAADPGTNSFINCFRGARVPMGPPGGRPNGPPGHPRHEQG